LISSFMVFTIIIVNYNWVVLSFSTDFNNGIIRTTADKNTFIYNIILKIMLKKVILPGVPNNQQRN